MKRTLGIPATIVVAMLAVAPLAHGAEQTRESYVAQVEPICKRDTLRSKRILAGARDRIKDKNFVPAGRQFIRVSKTFGSAVRRIVGVPRPPADQVRLRKWIEFLRVVEMRLRDLGKKLKEREELKATYASIKLERSSNAANNVGFVYGFDYCRFTRSRFS